MKNPGKVRARTYGTKLPSRSEALRFIDSAKFPSTKIDGSLVNFRRRLSDWHGEPRRMLTMDIRRTPIGLWARLRDSHKSGPQSGWSLAWSLAQRNSWQWTFEEHRSDCEHVYVIRTSRVLSPDGAWPDRWLSGIIIPLSQRSGQAPSGLRTRLVRIT